MLERWKLLKNPVVLLVMLIALSISCQASISTGLAVDRDPLVVAYDPYLPPIQYKDDEGKAKGFSVDIIEKIAKENDFSIKYIPLSLKESRVALQNNEIDIILGINYTQELDDKVNFTESYFTSSAGLVVSQSNERIENVSDLTNTLVALQYGTVEYNFLKNLRRINYNVTNNQVLALELLAKDRAEAYVGERYTQNYFLEETNMGEEFKLVSSYVAPIEYSMAVSLEDRELLGMLNSSLSDLRREGIYNEIYQNWFVDERSAIDRFLRTLVIAMSVVLTGFAFFIAIGYRWNKQLQKEVDKKTKDLINTYQMKNQVLESSPRGVLAFDLNGVITSYNSRSAEIAECKEHLEGMNVTEIDLFNKILENHHKNLKESSDYENVEEFIGQEINWQNKQNKELTIRYNVYPLYDYQKEKIGTILSFEDITEEKKIREEMYDREKSSALNRVVAGICHEIRNPITSVKTFTELLPLKYEDPEFRKELSTYVPSEMDRLSNLIENLFDYAKPKTQTKEVVCLTDIIDSCVVLCKHLINQNGIKMEVNIEEDVKIEVEKNQLKQVMLNLTLNAVSAITAEFEHVDADDKSSINDSEKERKIVIKGKRRNNKAVISVKDTGRGMTPEELKKAVEPFYTTKKVGTGLGLALSKQYVEENSGKLKIDSVRGLYTIVYLEFPIKEEKGHD
ncbi:transporter substrate-binding domain-containing protein [Natranaerofaba carboxydovora]|uniref:transporter substrate-binding domain-containing protein n=1 Tax=Natranaerofaba carboxydovora TaxID=2742683 RepID=UPI001F12FB4B|nr:transporter substrate-binding domain-containing protein [Natranaerofaba carboxydovora]UMZ73712.1 Sensor protein ZraS [Natranaerofaba carboxydovora]